MITRTVTGTFYNPDGTPAAGLVVMLRMVTYLYDETGHALTLPTLTETANASGVITAELLVGAQYEVTAAGQRRFTVTIPAGSGTLTLEGLHASGEVATPVTDAHQVAIHAALTDYLRTADADALYATLAGLATETTNRTTADTALQADINTRLTQGAADTRYALASALASYLTTAAAALTYATRASIWGPRYAPGIWLHSTAIHSSITTMTASAGWLYLTPMQVTRSITIDRVRFEVTVVGSADCVVNIGLYAEDASTGRPGTLTATLASVPNPSATTHEVVVSQALTPGWYYIGWLVTGTTGPVVRATGSPSLGLLGTSVMTTLNQIGALVQTGLGALPSPPTITSGNSATSPQVDYRVGSMT